MDSSMLLTPSALQAVRVGLDGIFRTAYNAVQKDDLWHMQLATERPSTDAANLYHFLAQLPRMKKWLGPRIFHNLSQYAYQLLNEDFDDGFEISRNDVEDDKLGNYSDAMQMLGRSARLWPNDVVLATIIAAGALVCYDGQYYFDTDHPLKVSGQADTVQANLHTGTPLTAANYGVVRTAMLSRKGDDGLSMGVRPGLLVVPAALEDMGKRILKSDNSGSLTTSGATATEDNIHKGTAELLVLPDLDATSTTTWYLADVSKPMKPLIFQNRRAPNRIDVFDKPTDANVFNDKNIKVGCDGRGAGGVGLWQLMDKCTA